MAKNSVRKEMRFAQMVDYGNHNKLVSRKGIYSNLWNLQTNY